MANLPCFYGIQIISVPEQQHTDALYLHLLSDTCASRAGSQAESFVSWLIALLFHAERQIRRDTPFGKSSGFITGMKFPPTSASAAAPLFCSLVLDAAPFLSSFVSAVSHSLKVDPAGGAGNFFPSKQGQHQNSNSTSGFCSCFDIALITSCHVTETQRSLTLQASAAVCNLKGTASSHASMQRLLAHMI